jgi:hypothetical protein
MRYNIILFAVIAAAILLNACTTDINLHLDSVAPQLVVDGTVTTDTMAHTVWLKKTSPYFSNAAAQPVSGAKVTLSDGNTTITLAEDSSNPGAYKTPAGYYGVAGRTYSIDISNVDIDADGTTEEYTASSTINKAPPVEKIDVVASRLFSRDVWEVKLWMQDDPAVANYYLARIYRNSVCVSDSINEWGITDDEFFNGVYLKNETIMFFSSEKKDEQLESGDAVMLELCGITQDYMNFISEVKEEYRGRNPLFGGQPANIRTNVVQLRPNGVPNAAHGYFAAYSVTRSRTIYR